MARRFYLPQSTSFRPTKAPRRLKIPRLRAVLIALAVLVVGFGSWWIFTSMSSAPTGPRSTPLSSRVPIGSSVQDTEQPRDPAPQSASTQATTDRAIRIQLMNGCGVRGLAQRAATALRTRGFDVREMGNASGGKEYYTKVNDRIGNMQLAQRVADSLGIDYSRVSRDTSWIQPDIDVTVILGMDYERLKLNLKSTTKE